MSRLLSRTTLASMSGKNVYLDPDKYSDPMLSAVFNAVDSMVCKFLHFVPYLTHHTAEEGVAHYLEAGDYAGRYLLTLQNRPLVPGTPAQIFTSLQLRYALATAVPSTVDLSYVQVDHATARVYALAPGAIDALTSIGFQSAPLRGLRATSFVASYWAGKLTGVNDGTPPTGVTVLPIEPDLTMAASYLAIEMLQMQATQAQQGAMAPIAGPTIGIRVGEREQRFASGGARSNGMGSLGFGGQWSLAAESLLSRYRRFPSPVLV